MTASVLCLAIVALWSDVPQDRACSAAEAIVETGSPPLLVALFAPESGLDNTRVNPRSGACGIGQVLYSHDLVIQRRRCRAVLASVTNGARAANRKLSDAVRFCGNLGGRPAAARYGLERCAVAGYVGGVPAVYALARGERWILDVTAARLRDRDELVRIYDGMRQDGGAGL